MWIRVGIGLVLLIILSFGSMYFYNAGGDACEARHSKAQLEEEIKTRKKYDKIDKQTPYHKSLADKLDWLLQNGRKL